METLRSNVNNMTDYPNKETMELFLQLWNKFWILENITMNWVKNYTRYEAVSTLAVVCEYLCQQWKEKELFLAELEKQWEMYYKTMWELALNIRKQKWNLSNYSKAMIESNRKRLEGKKPGDYPYFPLICENDFSKRIQDLTPQRMIHEEFEAELARLKWVSEWADQIQAESKNHTFDRWDNSGQISDLESKL